MERGVKNIVWAKRVVKDVNEGRKRKNIDASCTVDLFGHYSGPSNGLAHGAWSVTPKAVGTSKNVKLEAFQFSAWTMAAVLPVGMLFSPSFLNMPFDLILAFVVPFHAWYGVHHVIEDYVPPQFQPASNALLYVITAVAVLGLVNLSVQGDGILESIKSLWRDEKDKDDKKSKK